MVAYLLAPAGQGLEQLAREIDVDDARQVKRIPRPEDEPGLAIDDFFTIAPTSATWLAARICNRGRGTPLCKISYTASIITSAP